MVTKQEKSLLSHVKRRSAAISREAAKKAWRMRKQQTEARKKIDRGANH